MYHTTCNKEANVSTPIVDGRWWIPHALKHTVQHVCQWIENTSIEGGHDEIVWTVSKSGEFELKIAYNELRNKKALNGWYKVLWHSINIPGIPSYRGWQ